MLLSSLRSSFLSISPLIKYKFTKESDPDFMKHTKTNITIDNVKDFIDKLVHSNDVLLFMKGSVDRPQCGYSNTVVKILQQLGVKNIKGVNILADPIMREQVKVYSDWPTYPQLYVKGKFVGGCDIVR